MWDVSIPLHLCTRRQNLHEQCLYLYSDGVGLGTTLLLCGFCRMLVEKVLSTARPWGPWAGPHSVLFNSILSIHWERLGWVCWGEAVKSARGSHPEYFSLGPSLHTTAARVMHCGSAGEDRDLLPPLGFCEDFILLELAVMTLGFRGRLASSSQLQK